jgi:hypothetical protein
MMKEMLMSNNGKLQEYRNAPTKQKFAILTNEMTRPLATIRGYSMLLMQRSQEHSDIFSPEIGEWINKIVDAGNEIQDMLDTLAIDK